MKTAQVNSDWLNDSTLQMTAENWVSGRKVVKESSFSHKDMNLVCVLISFSHVKVVVHSQIILQMNFYFWKECKKSTADAKWVCGGLYHVSPFKDNVI